MIHCEMWHFATVVGKRKVLLKSLVEIKLKLWSYTFQSNWSATWSRCLGPALGGRCAPFICPCPIQSNTLKVRINVHRFFGPRFSCDIVTELSTPPHLFCLLVGALIIVLIILTYSATCCYSVGTAPGGGSVCTPPHHHCSDHCLDGAVIICHRRWWFETDPLKLN